MGVSFLIHKGERFQDDLRNVVTFLEYDDVTHCLYFDKDGVEFSMNFDNFMYQYCMGVIREVCDGQAATDLV